jgi:hypothetical protein
VSELAHPLAGTAANVMDIAQGDTCCMARKAARCAALPEGPECEASRAEERSKAQVYAIVGHPFPSALIQADRYFVLANTASLRLTPRLLFQIHASGYSHNQTTWRI